MLAVELDEVTHLVDTLWPDHYDREAITHVMGCVARLPGAFL